jgi:hypothetical protein
MVCTGEAMDKTVFLTSLEQARHGLDLYTVVTPEVTFPSVNIVHYDFRRTREHGATILFVEVWLTQIMNTVVTQTTLALTDTQNPDSQSNVSQGAVQPTQPQLLPGFVTNTQPIPGFVTNTQPLPGFVARPFGSG